MKLSEDEKQAKVFELIDSLSTAMLVTLNSSGDVHARPMAVALRQGDDLLFLTRSDTEKVAQAERNSSCNACFQERSRFVSVAGDIHIENDRARLAEIWDDRWKVWFPDGVDDETLVLLCMKPKSAEYWDYSGVAGLQFMLAWTKAILTDSGIDFQDTDATHARVEL